MRIKLTFPRNPFRDVAEFGINIPAAIARALNDTAFDARQELVQKLPEHFTLRGTWTEKGMRVGKASWKNLVAHVGSVRPYMKVQAEGGERPDPNGGFQVVPVGARPKKEFRTTVKNWPVSVAARQGAFAGVVKGVRGIWLRRGKTRKSKLRLIWRIVPKVQVKKSWPIEAEVEASVRKHWKRHCKLQLHKARNELRGRPRRST